MITNVTAKANYNNYNLGFKGAKDKPIMTLKDKLKFVGDTYRFGTKKGEKVAANQYTIEMANMTPEEKKEIVARQMLKSVSAEDIGFWTKLHASFLPKLENVTKSKK